MNPEIERKWHAFLLNYSKNNNVPITAALYNPRLLKEFKGGLSSPVTGCGCCGGCKACGPSGGCDSCGGGTDFGTQIGNEIMQILESNNFDEKQIILKNLIKSLAAIANA